MYCAKMKRKGVSGMMGQKQNWTHRGFTLIELVIVITILSILAAVALPVMQNMTARARDAAVQGAVGGVRSAIAVYRANELVEGRVTGTTGTAGGYPTLAQIKDTLDDVTTPKPLENGNIPDNPWCGSITGGTHCSGNKDLITDGATTDRIVTTTGGAAWRYATDTGLIYANTSASTTIAGNVKENGF